MSKRLPNIVKDKDRHGNVRYYYRPAHGPKIRLRAEPDTAEFRREYHLAANGTTEPTVYKTAETGLARSIIPGSLRALCRDYFESRDFTRLDEGSRHYRRSYLENICRSMNKDVNKARGDLPYAAYKRVNVLAIQADIHTSDYMCDTHVKALRVLFNWALQQGKVEFNPCLLIDSVAKKATGAKVWTKKDVEKFTAMYPRGTKEHLALALMFYTACRLSDAIRLGPQHVEMIEGVSYLKWTEYKGSHSKVVGKRAPTVKERQPMAFHPSLADIIDATPSGHPNYFLTSVRGKPWSEENFSIWFRKRCNAAGLPDRSSHGLRKLALTTMANNGASPHELMAVSGHTTIAQLKTYTDSVDRVRLGSAAILRLK